MTPLVAVWHDDAAADVTNEIPTHVHFLDDDLPSADFLDGVTAGGTNGNEVATSPAEIEVRAVGKAEAENPPDAGESVGTLRLAGL